MMEFTFVETTQLINAFKQHPSLWNPNILGYSDRKGKAEAWKTISAEVGVHSEICKRKMESLLSSCRREKAKILKSKASGNPADVQGPKWRYWNAFKFLRGLADDEEDPLGTAPEENTLEPKVNSPWSTSRMLAHKHRKAKPLPGINNKPSTTVSSPATSTQSKSNSPVPKEDDEYTAMGVTVEAKLRKMDYNQRLFAENIINQALYKGLLFQLTSQSEIRNTDFPTQTTSNITSSPTQTVIPVTGNTLSSTELHNNHALIQPNQSNQTIITHSSHNIQNQNTQWINDKYGMEFASTGIDPLTPTLNPLVKCSSDSMSHEPGRHSPSDDFKQITML